MDYPKTADEWWKSVNDNWSNLLSILHRYIGMNDNENIAGELTLEIRAIEIERMKSEKDRRIARYFNGAWLNAPDRPHIHSIPGWHVLCDLCSEEHVLDQIIKTEV